MTSLVMRSGCRRFLPSWLLSMAVLFLAGCDPAFLVDAARAARDAVQPAPPRPSTPIPAGGTTTAASEDTALVRAWFERAFIGSYRRLGRRSPKWDPAAETFLRESAPAFLGLALGTQDLKARARTLVQSGCDDPVVLYFAARALFLADDDSREASDLFERAVSGLHDVAYPRAVARFVASGLQADYERRSEGTGKRAALSPVELGWFLQSLNDGSYTADEDVVLTLHLTTGTGESFFERNRGAVVTALQATPWVDAWVRQLFSGIRHIDDAWDARSYGYSGEVKPEGWKGFEESLAAARQSLTESWRLRPDRPEAAAQMIVVAMGGGTGDPPRLWFDRAVEARFDHLPAYMKLINALRRRWSGDPGALLAFARECAETRRFDTQVPFMAFRAVQQMEEDHIEEARGEDDETADKDRPRPPSVYREEAVYRLVATVLERYRRDPGTTNRWQWWASLEVAVAYKAGRYADARKALEDVGGKLEGEAFDVVNEPQLAARIEAFASAEGAQIRRAEDLYRERRADQALPLFRKARTAVPATARPYLDQRIAASALETDLRAGRTIAFLPAAGMAGWTPRLGTWTVEPDGALRGTTGAKGLLIAADGRVGPDFEIEADVEIVSTSNGQFQVGVVFGIEPSFETNDWSSFRVKRTAHEGDVVYFSRHFYQPARSIQIAVGLRNHIVVQSWHGRLWAYFNGEAVLTDFAPEWKPPQTADVQVGFGAYLDDNTVTARYRDVRLRRLAGPPVAPSPRSRPAAR